MNANNFVAVKWAITTNNYATIDADTGMLTVTKVGTEEQAPSAQITAVVTLADGSTLTDTVTVGFYFRSCKLGDYVFADGTYSDQLDGSKTVVGVCFYIDPYDNSQRLCVALNDLPAYQWGLYSGNTDFTIGEIGLQDSPGYSVFDIPTLTNKGAHGMSTDYINAETYRDETTAGDSDGFKVFEAETVIAEIGFKVLRTKLGPYPEGIKLPYGLINTLNIITHRNIILSDSAINLPLPQTSDSMTCYQHLLQLMKDVVGDNGNEAKYSQFYYPAASLCNCYEPAIKQGEVLADKFKAGKWFLPSMGELARIYWYHSKGYEIGVTDAIFAQAVNDGLMVALLDKEYYSSAERTSADAWNINFLRGYAHPYGHKFYSILSRAVTMF